MEGRTSTGNVGLDAILRGGLPSNRLYLLEGAPGSGKTTLALQFLLEGAAAGESGLYITLSETREELSEVAASHGWSIERFSIFELASAEGVLGEARQQSILHPWEVELSGTIKLIQDEVEKTAPRRVVFDSLSEMRLLAQDPLRFRRQVLALKQFFAGRDTTVLLVDDLTSGGRDMQLHSLCHGVITLERTVLTFGAARRRLQVQKLRGIDFVAGFHDFVLVRGGLDVFPRLIASEHAKPFVGDPASSGIIEMDALLGGGPLYGTCTLITGPAGTGKTSIAMQYLWAQCERGQNCIVYEFDERVGTLLMRCKAMGLDLQKHIDRGCLVVEQIDPAEISPGEFASLVRQQVEARNCRMLLIDSLSGYLAAMPEEQYLILQIHELLAYLNQRGVATFLINSQSGLVGEDLAAPVNVSYIADAVVLLRFFEFAGHIRKAVSVLKNRSGPHEDTIRELRIDAGGIRVGEPLTEFRGVLSGTPEYVGPASPLLEKR